MDELTVISYQLFVFAFLPVCKDQSDSKAKELLGRVEGLDYEARKKISFALPELFGNSDEFLDSVAAAKEMKPYLNQFLNERDQQKYQLSQQEERLLLPTSRLQEGASYLYQTLVSSEIQFPQIEFPDGTVRKADYKAYKFVLGGQYTQEFRSRLFEAMMGAYREYRGTLAQNYHNYCVAVSESAALRGHDSALEAELLSTGTPPLVYREILKAADEGKPTFEKYLSLNKKELGVNQLYAFDVGTPFTKAPVNQYSYEEAKKLVKESLAPLGNDYSKKLSEMLQDGRIDVYPEEGKQVGAFAANITNIHPYILLNYNDNFDSVSTLSHELGHGVHMLYAQNQQTCYDKNPTILTTEVASLLNEILLSDYMIKNAKTDEERQYYYEQQMSMLQGSFYIQVFFARFQEKAVKVVEEGGTLTADKLDELWLSTTKECFGETYGITENYCGGWARIPHFYNGFYVYQYAVGIAAACDIAERIQRGEPGAVEDYISFLKAGDSADAVTVFEIAGVDISNSDYTKSLFERFERLMAEYE